MAFSSAGSNPNTKCIFLRQGMNPDCDLVPRYNQGDEKLSDGSADVITLCGLRTASVRYNGCMALRADPERGHSCVSWLSKIYVSGSVRLHNQVVHAFHAAMIHSCLTYSV